MGNFFARRTLGRAGILRNRQDSVVTEAGLDTTLPMLRTKKSFRTGNFFHDHSLSLVTAGVLTLWIVLYIFSDPNKHIGAFYGNAIADWSGSLVIIVATKYLLERGSEESRPVRGHLKRVLRNLVYEHSLSLFLVITGIGWLILYVKMDANSRWGQVVGNIVSEWVQTLGLVLMTTKLLERGSKESRKC
jgi:hypothetical protein